MQDSSVNAIRDKLGRVIEQADKKTQCVIMLTSYAIIRGDEPVRLGLEQLRQLPGPNSAEENIGSPDYELLGRLRRVCCKDEVVWWGRALVLAYLDGDRARKDALVGLILRRTAS